LNSAATSTIRPREARPAVATFHLVGDIRDVRFGGHGVQMPDLKGFRYLERLLAEPGREFHVLDLVAVEHGSLPGRSQATTTGHFDGAGMPALDDQARAAYRRRLAEVEEDLEEANLTNDLARLALAERDREFLMVELSRAVGLGGRGRTVGGTAERARTSVAHSLRYALRRLAGQQPDLGAHLDRAVRTGTYCSYVRDPLSPVTWELGGFRDGC